MKKILGVLGLAIFLIVLVGISVQAGEKEELQWKARALIAEVNIYQTKLNEGQKAIQEFIKELDAKGFMATQEGTIMEKPKSVEPKKENVIPAQPKF